MSLIGALAETRLRHDEQLLLPKRGPVALRVFQKLVGLRNPDRLAASLEPVVEQDACCLAAFARTCAVAKKEPFAKLHRLGIVLAREAQIVERFIDAVARGQESRGARYRRVLD